MATRLEKFFAYALGGDMLKLMHTSVFLIAGLIVAHTASASGGAIGRWKTIDDKTGEVKSIVEITSAADDTLTGNVVEIVKSDKGPNPVCTDCSGDRKDKPIKGMTILWNLKANGTGKWSGGNILDPTNGKTYKSKMALQEGGQKLDVSGCVSVICRAQTWVRE